MASKHFSDISIERVGNEVLARALGGSWMVVYKRNGQLKSNTFHTAGVAAAFAAKLEVGDLDDEALLGTVATPQPEADMLSQQNAELNTVLTASLRTSSLAYFAARAPQEIPDWYLGPDLPPLACPKPHESIAKEASDWHADPIYDLDGIFPKGDPRRTHACAYQEATHVFHDAAAQRRAAAAKTRYFAWRWHYAEQMVAAGEKAGVA